MTTEQQELAMAAAKRQYRRLMDELDTVLERHGYRAPAELADLVHDMVVAPQYDVRERSVARLAHDLRLWT